MRVVLTADEPRDLWAVSCVRLAAHREEQRVPASPPRELEVFTAREMPRVVGSLALYCGDRDVAEELAQEALVRVCRDWEQVKAMEYPGAWLHRVAINLAHSHYRRRQAGRRARRRVEARAGVPALLPDTADALAVRDALARLPDRHRQVLVLRYWADLSMAETAVALGISLPAAKSRASRATAALAALLHDTEDVHAG